MTEAQVKKLKVGSVVQTIIGSPQMVTEITPDGFYVCRWIGPEGKLSEGACYKVPCHFKYDTLVQE